MILRQALLTSALAMTAGLVCAQKASEIVPILSCDMPNGRHVDVSIIGDTARYAFGPKDAPELVLQPKLPEVEATAWAGVGRAIWEDITFFNAGYAYQVWYSIDRLTEGFPTSGGVRVSRDGVELAVLECIDGTADVAGFGVSDGFALAGYCWNPEAHRYDAGC